MMKKNRALVIAISCVFVAIIGVVAALAITGKIGNGEGSSLSTTAAPTEKVLEAASRPKTAIPEEIVAAVLTQLGTNEGKDPTNELELIAEDGFNTVIFDTDTLTAEAVALLPQYLEAAKNCSLYHGIIADTSKTDFNAAMLAVDNNMDFVILKCSGVAADSLSSTLAPVCDGIKKTDSLISIGFEPAAAVEDIKIISALTADKTVDFVYLRQEGRSAKQTDAFRLARDAWNDQNARVWLYHDLTGLGSVSTDEANEIIALINECTDMQLCSGISFGPWSDIEGASSEPATSVLSYIKERENYLKDKEFSVTNYKDTTIDVYESGITFRGTSSPSFPLTCNGAEVERAATGDFSVDVTLNVGANTVKFIHKDVEYSYTVNYKIKLLKSVSPSSTVEVPGGTQIDIIAVAHKDATVTASFNGKTYNMAKGGAPVGDDEASPNSDTDFASFAATVTLPDGGSAAKSLGKIKVTAKYQSLTESLTGASVTVTPVAVIVVPETTKKPTTTTTTTTTTTETQPTETITDEYGAIVTQPTTETTSDTTTETQTDAPITDKYTPYSSHGLGKAKICEIIDDYVEVYPGSTNTTYSMPSYSPLLKGTYDYVTGEMTCDGDKYYVLSSGIKVPAYREERLDSGVEGKITHVKITDSGYVMPNNSIRVVETKVAGGETVIKLAMNWNVVFNCELTGQSYSNVTIGGTVRQFGVSSVNCKALEITFYNTDSATGHLDFASSVFSSGSWSKSGNKVTLKLNLAKAGAFYGYDYHYDANGYLIITAKQKPSGSLNGYTVLLDPGHGGVDSGAVCVSSALNFNYEKNINLSIALMVREKLVAKGATVYMTRTTDDWVSYAERNAAVREHDPDLFISIHCDSSSDASPIGTSAFYYRAYSQPLAKAIHDSIVNAYKTEIYAGKSSSLLNRVDRKTSFYPFRVTRVEQCPAILIECGFVSNAAECELLQKSSTRAVLADAIVTGIDNYIDAL